MIKRALVLLASLTAMSSFAVTPAASAEEEPTFVFDGGGWGHGVGLSQFGAYGMVLEDPTITAEQIIEHYYQGVTVGTISTDTVAEWIATEEMPLWVGLFQKEATVTFKPVGGPATLCYGGNEEPTCDLQAQDGEIWQFQYFSGGCELARKDPEGTYVGQTGVLPCGGSVTPASPDIIIDMVNISTQYKNGILRVRIPPTEIGLHAVWQTGIESYVRGIAEMPDSWGGTVAQAALEAQAIVARTYAVNRATARTRPPETRPPLFTPQRENSCWCNLRDDIYDQVFNGWTGESKKPNSALAATDTAGQVVLFDGSTAQTYYFSSSFGETENVEDVFVQTLPYLRSVDDHWATGAAVGNTFARWSVTYTASELATRLGWQRVDGVDLTSSAPGSRVRVQGVDSAGTAISKEFRGEDLRSPLSLLSPQITSINGAGATAGVPNFMDIDGSVHEADIVALAQLGITKGCNPPDNDRFCPDDLVTRGQMAAFLGRAVGLSMGADDDVFTDDNGSVFETDIERLWVARITRGCNPPDNDRYCPDNPVTRGQMAAFLGRSFGYTDAGAGDFFTDDDLSIFENDIDRLFVAGVTKGCNPPDNDRYCPDESVTRAQMASFIVRALTGS